MVGERKPEKPETKLNYEEAVEIFKTFWDRKDFDKARKELKKDERAVREDLCNRLRREFFEFEGELRRLNDILRAHKSLEDLWKFYQENGEFDPDREFRRFLEEQGEKFSKAIDWGLKELHFKKGTKEYNCFIFYNILKLKTEYLQLIQFIEPRYEKWKREFNRDLRRVVKKAYEISQGVDKMKAQKSYILDTNIYFLSDSFWKLFFKEYKRNLAGKMELLREGALDKEFRKQYRHLYGFFMKIYGFLPSVPKVTWIRQAGLDKGETEALEILHERLSRDRDGNFYTGDQEALERGRNLLKGNEDRIQFSLRFFVDFIIFLHKFQIKDFLKKFQSKFQSIYDELGENIVGQIKKEFREDLRETLPDFFEYIEKSIVLHATGE